jgi:hypothetical protein
MFSVTRALETDTERFKIMKEGLWMDMEMSA